MTKTKSHPSQKFYFVCVMFNEYAIRFRSNKAYRGFLNKA